jgi:hypothetical protein
MFQHTLHKNIRHVASIATTRRLWLVVVSIAAATIVMVGGATSVVLFLVIHKYQQSPKWQNT